GDEPLVLEELQRRVDGAGAGPPGAAALLVDALDQLVAVAGRFVEDAQQRRADVAAAHPATPSPAPATADFVVQVPRSTEAVSLLSHECLPFGRGHAATIYGDRLR